MWLEESCASWKFSKPVEKHGGGERGRNAAAAGGMELGLLARDSHCGAVKFCKKAPVI